MSETQTIQLGLDGNQWCALLGDNLQEGTAGFGDTPSDALHQLAFKLAHSAPDGQAAPKLSIDEELLDKVTHYLAIKPHVKECDTLHKLIKTTVEGEPFIELGPYDITGQYVTRKAYIAEVKETTFWKMDIKPNPARAALVKR